MPGAAREGGAAGVEEGLATKWRCLPPPGGPGLAHKCNNEKELQLRNEYKTEASFRTTCYYLVCVRIAVTYFFVFFQLVLQFY